MNTINAADDDNLRRIADALERIANHYDRPSKPVNTTVTLTGNYAGAKDQLAATIRDAIKDAVAKGTIPKNWAA